MQILGNIRIAKLPIYLNHILIFKRLKKNVFNLEHEIIINNSFILRSMHSENPEKFPI